jgi:hypothetical protein
MTTGSTPGNLPPATASTGSPGAPTTGTAAYASAGPTVTTGAATDTPTRDVAKDEARGVAQDVAQSGRQTTETAKEQAGQVAAEAKSQAKQLLDQTREQVVSTGSAQQEKAATGLRSLADELSGMVNGQGGQDGLAADLARQASDQIRTAAQFLESREPADLLQELRGFARRRPGTFLLSAAAIGFLGGRVTRGLAADSNDTGSGPTSGVTGGVTSRAHGSNSVSLTSAPGAPSLSGTPAGDTVPTGPTGTGGGIGARSGGDFERPAGGDAPLSGYAVPPERTGADPHGDPTATFNPAPQAGGPGEDRI